jgi:hypothetical protein
MHVEGTPNCTYMHAFDTASEFAFNSRCPLCKLVLIYLSKLLLTESCEKKTTVKQLHALFNDLGDVLAFKAVFTLLRSISPIFTQDRS